MAIEIYHRPKTTLFQDLIALGGAGTGGSFVGLCLVVGIPLGGLWLWCKGSDIAVMDGLVPALHTENRAHQVGSQGYYFGIILLVVGAGWLLLKIVEKLSSAKVEVKLPKAEKAHAPAHGGGHGGDHGGHGGDHGGHGKKAAH